MALRSSLKWLAVGVTVLVVFLLVAFLTMRQRGRADIADGQTRAALDVGSSSFNNGGWMPPRLTCLGAKLSPALKYSLLPVGTKSTTIVMDDSDSPFGFVHWLVYNIPSKAHAIVEGASLQKRLPSGATEGVNSADTNGYTSPCPPGTKPHHYVILVYALETDASLPPGMTKQQLASAVSGHVLAEGQLTGIYGRSGS